MIEAAAGVLNEAPPAADLALVAEAMLKAARVPEILQYEDRGDFLVYREEWDHLKGECDDLAADVERLRAGIQWARGMCSDTEPWTKIDTYLGGLLR